MRLSNISLRAFTRAMLLALAGVAVASTTQSGAVKAAADVPTQVSFTFLASCNLGGAPLLTGKVGGATVGTYNPAVNCACVGPTTVTSTDPTVLAAVSSPACTDLSATLTGGNTYVAWIRADITRSESGVESSCLTDTFGGSCDVNNLCSAGYEQKVAGFNASTGPGDTDGDGQNNCTDPDIDGDGVDNAGDLCPLMADSSNTDSDGDGVGDACEPLVVRTVPWLGLPNKAHEVYSGGSLVLQGTATNGYTDTPASNIVSAVWDPGDGSAVQSVSFANPLAIELTQTYSGTDGQPFTATLTVTNASGDVATDTFRIVVKTKTIDVEANMAIDKGLWYLHKQITRSTLEGVNVGTISHTNYNTTAAHIATTAGAAQAMQINNHVTDGQLAQDPYIHDVDRMLRWLETQLATQTLNAQNGNNPDANGNSIGIYPNDASVVNYVTGQVMDAFVSSGTPSRKAVLGGTNVRGRDYAALVQDMMDYNNWSQIDTGFGRGSWHYTASNNTATGHDDNSIAQWPAIGGIAAERVWGLTTPAWVKPEILSFLPKTYNAGGSSGGLSYQGAFGYSTQNNLPWSEGFATTPSALIQYIWAGVAKDPTPDNDPEAKAHDGFRYVARYHRVRNNYRCCDTTGHINGINFYALYATTKAYRLALNDVGVPEPVTLVDDDPADAVPAWNWYYNDPPAGAPASAGPVGVARAVIANQQAGGQFPGTYLWTGNMSTAWGVIILSPSLFQLGPTASCTANPSEIGTGGGTVNFNASGSSHNDDDGVIVSYVWDFDDGSAPGAGVTTTHTYGPGTTFPRTFNATVTVTDENGLTDTATCAVTQVDTNVAPDADAGGSYAFCMGSPMILDGSGSTDAEDGEPSSWEWDFTSPLNFTPPDGSGETFNATAHFTALGPGTYDLGLRVADSFGKTNAEFTTVTVKAASDPGCNQPPVANDDAPTTAEDTTLNGNVVSNDTDPDAGDTLTATLVSDTSNGALTLNPDGSFTYTPDAEFCGTDSFTYKVNDGTVDSNTATATITVTCVNDAPTAGDDANATNEDTPVGGSVTGNDSDIDGDALSYGGASDPANGSVTLNPDGSYTYTPDGDFNGTDSFTYIVSDGNGGTATGTVTISVAPVNDAPSAGDDSNSTDEDTPVSGSVATNDTDVDGDALSYGGASDPANGSVTLNADGSYTYTPDANFNGTDSFTYTVSDGNGGSTTGTVTISVAPVNDAPSAGDDSNSTDEDTPVSGSVATNDTDVDGDALSYGGASDPANGSVTLNADGSYTYTPDANFYGTDSFTYTVSDGNGGSDTATVTINVAPVNDVPVCTAAAPSIGSLWPPNHELTNVDVNGVTDPVESSAITITITGIWQDEPTNTIGDGNTSIDGFGVGTSTAQLRAERSGSKRVPGDGRMYYVFFTGTDAEGGQCTGTVKVGVPHDLGQDHAIGDAGPIYKSTGS